jgi:hypothetical protein
MQYNLLHRGTVIKTFDTNAMEPDEVWAMKRLGDGRYFEVQRINTERLPPMPEGFDNLAGISGWDYRANPERYIPANHRY